MARRLELSATMLRMPDERVRRELRESLYAGAGEIQEWLGLADREKTSAPSEIAALRQAADSTVTLMSAIDGGRSPTGASLTIPLREYLARTLHEMAAILRAGSCPTAITWQPPETDRPLTPLEANVLAAVKDAIIRFAECRILSRGLTKSQRNRAASLSLMPFPIRITFTMR